MKTLLTPAFVSVSVVVCICCALTTATCGQSLVLRNFSVLKISIEAAQANNDPNKAADSEQNPCLDNDPFSGESAFLRNHFVHSRHDLQRHWFYSASALFFRAVGGSYLWQIWKFKPCVKNKTPVAMTQRQDAREIEAFSSGVLTAAWSIMSGYSNYSYYTRFLLSLPGNFPRVGRVPQMVLRCFGERGGSRGAQSKKEAACLPKLTPVLG